MCVTRQDNALDGHAAAAAGARSYDLSSGGKGPDAEDWVAPTSPPRTSNQRCLVGQGDAGRAQCCLDWLKEAVEGDYWRRQDHPVQAGNPARRRTVHDATKRPGVASSARLRDDRAGSANVSGDGHLPAEAPGATCLGMGLTHGIILTGAVAPRWSRIAPGASEVTLDALSLSRRAMARRRSSHAPHRANCRRSPRKTRHSFPDRRSPGDPR